MLKSFILSAFLGAAFLGANAQTLPMPPNIAAAYAKGTHDKNGKPGKSYWENHGRYNISVTVNPPHGTVKGTEQITYFNNSPDKLDSLNMKLIVNMHLAPQRGGGTPDRATGITVDDIKINGSAATWDNNAAVTTNYMLGLKKPLMPHDSVKLDINWHYLLTNSKGGGGGREGTIDTTTFFLAYFYPRVSVYDDTKGWDTQPHTGSLEFYNDFNDYTLNVTVPKNFIVWATGTLRNPEKVLQPAYAKKLAASMTSDSTIHIATQADLASKNVTAQSENNTWTWTSTDITDVALAVSNTYDWDAASVVVAPNRRVSVQAAFNDGSQDFHHYVQYARNSLDLLSHNLPGVPYPFPKTTSVEGFADMEYPMMVNDSHTDDLKFAQMVQDHEIAHTYMPFYMGINESYYAFMDEGWATTFELLLGTIEMGKQAAETTYKGFRIQGWNRGNHANEIPIITPSPQAPGGNNAYNKPSLSYLAVKDLLGDDLFKKALQTYMANWHSKHPIPWDYFYSMSAGAGKNLDWFFNNWFFTKYWVDVALDNAEKTSTGYTLSVKNIGGFASPFDVVVSYADGTTDTFHETPGVWEKDQRQTSVKVKTTKDVKSITLDGGVFMDADLKNNTWTAAK